MESSDVLVTLRPRGVTKATASAVIYVLGRTWQSPLSTAMSLRLLLYFKFFKSRTTFYVKQGSLTSVSTIRLNYRKNSPSLLPGVSYCSNVTAFLCLSYLTNHSNPVYITRHSSLALVPLSSPFPLPILPHLVRPPMFDCSGRLYTNK